MCKISLTAPSRLFILFVYALKEKNLLVQSQCKVASAKSTRLEA